MILLLSLRADLLFCAPFTEHLVHGRHEVRSRSRGGNTSTQNDLVRNIFAIKCFRVVGILMDFVTGQIHACEQTLAA